MPSLFRAAPSAPAQRQHIDDIPGTWDSIEGAAFDDIGVSVSPWTPALLRTPPSPPAGHVNLDDIPGTWDSIEGAAFDEIGVTTGTWRPALVKQSQQSGNSSLIKASA